LKGERAEIADVDKVIDSGTAGVHADCIADEWLKGFQFLREGVIETKSHCRESRLNRNKRVQ
jgi:hypothetical protein